MGERRTFIALKLFLLSGAALTMMSLIACSKDASMAAAAMTGGDPEKGRAAIARYGCASCHTIPGISGADALVGPPLTKMGSRMYIAGVLENNPDNMLRWIRNPQGVDHLTAMPDLGVTERDARDIAAYLYTLK